MDKLPVGQLPDLLSSNNDDEIMVITNSEYNQLKKEKISDLITDFTSTNENNALTKGTDGKMFVTDFGNASNITEGKLPVSVLPDIPKDLLPEIETADLPASGVVANTYTYPSSVTVNAQGQVTAISEGSPSGANANTDLSNITEAGKEVIRENSGSGFNMFDLVIKDHVLSFEESKGLSLQGTYVYKDAVSGSRYGYPDFYAKCIAEKTAGTETQTKLGEVTITTYNNSNGHIFYDIADKSTVDAYFESTGEAWFFGVDTVNERIFLPRTTRFQFTNDTSKVGEYQEAGLPNVEGEISIGTDGTTYTGAFGQKRFNQRLYGAGTNAGQGLTFNASASNPIYGSSDTVTPAATNQLLYIVVGNTEVESAITDITDITTTENDTIPLFAPMYFDFEPNSTAWLIAGGQKNNGGLYASTYATLVQELTKPKYNLKVIDVDDMVADTDYSLYWKVDQTSQTFTTPVRTEERILVAKKEATTEDSTWYNWYSDGWLEQGGRFNATGEGGSYKVDFLKSFSDTLYSIEATSGQSGLTGTGHVGYDTSAISTTDVTIRWSGLSSPVVNWKVAGYGSIPQPADYTESQLYFKVSNAVQNLQVINVGEITTALALKTDAEQAAHASMPGNKSDELTLLPTLGTYTAPADGYYSIGVVVTSARGFICLEINPDDNDNSAQKLRAYAHGAGNGDWTSIFVPVSKGDTARVQYQDVSSTFLCKFVYAQGAA